MRLKYFIKECIIPFLISLFIVLLINIFIFQLTKVPTGSMQNTIQIGDRVYVNKLFNIDKAKRGDILVFKSREINKPLVKRLIGLPGETIDIKENGDVYVNGNKLDEPYAIKSTGKEQSFIVPEDSYFFLGDNRPNSEDSRYWDNPFINKKDIKGEAIFIIFPFNRIGKLE